MASDVGILSLKAIYNPSNIGQITNEVKKDIEKIEKSAGDIDLKVNAPDMGDFKKRILDASSEIQKLQSRQLKGYNISGQMSGLFGVLADPNKDAKDYAEAFESTLGKLKKILSIPDSNLMKDFNDRELNTVLRKQADVDFKQAELDSKKANAVSQARNIRAKSIEKILEDFSDEDRKLYNSALSQDNISKLSKEIGLSNNNDAKSDVEEYAKLLSIYEQLAKKKKELSEIKTPDDALESIKQGKTLNSIANQISQQEAKLKSNFGATNLKGKLEKQDIHELSGKYIELTTKQLNKELEAAQKNREEYIISTASKKALNQTQKEFDQIDSSKKRYEKQYGVKLDDKSQIISTPKETRPIMQENKSDSSNLMSQAFENIKRDYLSYQKYAVDKETAIKELESIASKFKKNQTLDLSDLKYAEGLSERLSALGVDSDDNIIPSSVKKMFDSDDYQDLLYLKMSDADYDSLQNISKMTAAQLSEIEKLKQAKQDISDTSPVDTKYRSALFEEFDGQMALFDTVPSSSKEIVKSQDDIKKRIKSTNDDIEGQISLFDTLNKQEFKENQKKDSLPKDSEDKYDLFEESDGQMAMFDSLSKPSDNVINSQKDVNKQIQNTNDNIEGQINLFDILNEQEQKNSKKKKKDDEKPKVSTPIHESDLQSDISILKAIDSTAEASSMQSLSSAVQQVTEAVNNKTMAFLEEEDVVSQVANLEMSNMQSLKNSIDQVSDSVDKQKEKLDEYKKNAKESNEDIKNNEEDPKKESPKRNTSVRSSNQSRKNNSSPKISETPSTYVKNIDRAYDEAMKINAAIDKAEAIKSDLAKTATEASKDVASKAYEDIDRIIDRLKTSDRPGVASANNELDRIQTTATQLSNALNKGALFKAGLNSSNVSGMPTVISNVTSAVDALDNKLKSGAISVQQYDSRLNKLEQSLKHVDDYAENSSEALQKMNQSIRSRLGNDAKITHKPTKFDPDGNATETLEGTLNGSKYVGTWNESIGTIVSTTTTETKKATSVLGDFFSGLKQRWMSLGQYLLSFGSFYEVFDVLKQGFNIAKDLDDALTEMNKVSDAPLFKLKNYQKESFGIADEIGATGLQIQQSTADFLRLGESFDEAKKSAEAANILYNVSEFESIDAATESLIAMSAAYRDMDKMAINDKLNNVGNNFSISTDGLATALQTSASALVTAGADIDKSIALITAGNAVVQDPASVGAGVRTIALRLMGTEEAKQQLEATGEDTSDYIVQTASKINDSFKAFTAVASNDFEGISILDENGNNRDVYEILQDVADIYDEIVATDKEFGTNHLNGLLELMAGKNRSNIAASIIQNKDILRDAYEASQNSEGSALEENQKYLDSISGHLDQLKNKWQEVWSGTGRDVVNPILDIGSSILDIVNNVGLLQTVLGGIAAGFGVKGLFKKDGLISTLFGWSNLPGLQLKII